MRMTWGKIMLVEMAVCLGLVLGIFRLNPGYYASFPRTVIARSYAALRQGNISAGHYQGMPNRLNLSLLQPGDIILVGDAGCSYGHFSHTALYVGDQQTVEGFIDTGVILCSAAHLRRYDFFAVLRPQVAASKRAAAAAYARALESGPVWVAFKPGAQYWSCSKISYTAYLQQGVDLDQSPDIIPTPDAFYASPSVAVIQEGGR